MVVVVVVVMVVVVVVAVMVVVVVVVVVVVIVVVVVVVGMLVMVVVLVVVVIVLVVIVAVLTLWPYSRCGRGARCLVMVTWRFRVGVAVMSGCGVGHEQLSMAVGGRRRQWAMSTSVTHFWVPMRYINSLI